MTFANGQNVIAIVGGTVIDGNGGPPIRNGVIIIQDNKISEIGRVIEIWNPSSLKSGTRHGQNLASAMRWRR